jgi:hypothetical protein
VLLIWACPILVVVVWLADRMDTATALILTSAFALIAGFITWDRWWIFRYFAERVTLSERGIEATRFSGQSVGLTWEEIVLRQEHERRDPFRGVFPQIRLIGREPAVRIVLDGEMSGFNDLAREVRARTPHARPGGDRQWWERVFRPG